MTCPSILTKNVRSLALLAAITASVSGEPPAGMHHPTRLLVKLRHPAGGAPAAGVSVASVGGLRVVRTFRAQPGLVLVNADRPLDEAMAMVRQQPDVVYVEPDYVVRATETPNDPHFPTLWAFENSGATINGDPGVAGSDARATAAWDFWQGDQNFRIAVIDSGIDYTHPDLADNIWTNPGEIADNGVDDDKNGYVDDVHGHHFAGGPSPDPMDDHGHGTHVAGIIGARGDNGIGVVGVAWRCQLVPIKFLDSAGNGLVSDAVDALQYAIDNGIKVSNNSWGCYSCYSQALRDTIETAATAGHLFVASSGNGILGVSTNTDDFPNYPSGYDLPNIIAVGASDQKDRKAVFSNDGQISVDLAAPGVNLFSTHLGGDYLFRSGTSMAAPLVTGAVALIWSRLPQLDWMEVRERTLLTAREVPAFLGITATGAIVDIGAMVADCNHNGTLDDDEIAVGDLHDCNGNLLADICEHDCNGNQLDDSCDVGSGTSLDCNTNGVPDECEPDCNANDVADACDIAGGLSDDCNENDIPDECEPGHDADCNLNETADLCDVASGLGSDCNANGVLDECDILLGSASDCTDNGVPDECEPDCNENGLADSCDIALGTSDDLDGDSIPDECAGFSLTPVVASGQHFISGNKLTLVRGAQRIVADFRMSGWDPDQDGFPRLRLYQAGLEIPGLDLGSDGPFEFAVLNCTNNDDCLGDSLCVDGVCDIYGSLNIDTLRPDFVFYGLDAIATSAVFNQYPDVFAILIDYVEAVIDDGETRYAGTLVLDTNENAEGEFTIGFHEKSCVMEHTSEKIAKYDIPIPGFHPMIVVIQDGYDLLDASLLQNCASIDGETVDCAALDADGDGMVNTQDLRAFTALMAGPVP